MMDSLDKLRGMAVLLVVKGDGKAVSVDAIADEIEREIEREYMKRPVDARGKPIHIGDMMTSPLTDRPFQVRSLSRGTTGWFVTEDCPTMREYGALELFHYHPPTVEDVLREMLDEYESTDPHAMDVLFCEYAGKLRKVIGNE